MNQPTLKPESGFFRAKITHPYIPIRDKALKSCIQLMNELGLTPRSRLAAGKVEDESPFGKFMQGPLAG